MIKYINKDITTVTRGIVAHGVNCLGAMGSGVALAIRKSWPIVFFEYVQYCDIFKGPARNLLGMVQTIDVGNEVIVANCFTQEIYGNDGAVYADIRALEEALENVLAYAQHKNMPIYLPKIGCGLGGLDWDTQVEPILIRLGEEYEDINIFICDI